MRVFYARTLRLKMPLDMYDLALPMCSQQHMLQYFLTCVDPRWQDDGIEGDKITRKLVAAAMRGKKVWASAPVSPEAARKQVLNRLRNNKSGSG
jgi:hypothetical protein